MFRIFAILGGLAAAGTVAAWPVLQPCEREATIAARAAEAAPAPGIVLCGLPAARRAVSPTLRPNAAESAAAVADATEPAESTDVVVECDDGDGWDGPADPVEAGPCRLTLRFVSTGDERPVKPHADLWRLGAPGNRDWTWGDQNHGEGTWRDDALVYERLPLGRYRVQTLGARRSSEDPPAFDLQEPETEVRLVVPMPPTHRVFLVALDEHGRRLTTVTSLAGGWSTQQVEETPAWLRRRALRDAAHWGISSSDELEEHAITFGGGGQARRGAGMPIEAGPAGFEIGTFAEPSRHLSKTVSSTYHALGCSQIVLSVAADEEGEPGDRTYWGISVPVDPIAARVLLPDGRTALEAGAYVRVRSTALRQTATTDPLAWRRRVLRVRVTLEDHEDLAFETSLADPNPGWRMQPALR